MIERWIFSLFAFFLICYGVALVVPERVAWVLVAVGGAAALLMGILVIVAIWRA